jgi:hypothetical protein
LEKFLQCPDCPGESHRKVEIHPEEENLRLFTHRVYWADRVIAALSSASQSIDAMQVNFSADLICWLELVAPGYCTFEENALPWMKP